VGTSLITVKRPGSSRTAITVLPSVASLKAQHQFAKTSRATKPYLDIGNPLPDGQQDDPVWGAFYKEQAELARTKRCSQGPTSQQMASARGPRPVRGTASLFRGAQTDIEQIRICSPLPEIADELCEVARRLGVSESDILLGANATETRLKELSAQGRLADYAILHFGTHGALTGQVQDRRAPFDLDAAAQGHQRRTSSGARRRASHGMRDVHFARPRGPCP
jgi:CHAT domain